MSFIETIIHWETSPEELRKLADKMDKQKSDARPGETTCVRIIRISETDDKQLVTLYVHYTQD